MYQLISDNNKIIAVYNSIDAQKVYQDARNYLLAQDHVAREKNAEIECNRVHLYDAFNRKIKTYHIDRFASVYQEEGNHDR